MRKLAVVALAIAWCLTQAGAGLAWTTEKMPGILSYEGGKAQWDFASVAYVQEAGKTWLLGVQYGGTGLPNKFLPSTLIEEGLWELPVNEAAFNRGQDKFAWVFLNEEEYKAVTANGFTASQRTQDFLEDHALWVNLGEARAREPFHFEDSQIGLFTVLDHY